MEFTPEIEERLKKLKEKYNTMGQDITSYLDGLLYSNNLTYWDYVHLDTLLSLQNTRTDFPDEKIFIIYHQITELYFKLIKLELEQICHQYQTDLKEWEMRLSRVINYFKHLTQSFTVMIDGMEKEQFLKFRMALLPASGFQSVQYREIEIMCTDLMNLAKSDIRSDFSLDDSLLKVYDAIYWKSGNKELKSGKKTLTLEMFEERYDDDLVRLADKYQYSNLRALYRTAPSKIRESEKIKEQLQELDLFGNVFWPLSHYKSAIRYLHAKPDIIAATGGTNWQKYLPPNFQRVIFFPELWTEEQKKDWGKTWVMNVLKEMGLTELVNG